MPLASNIFIPLSKKLLCDALITRPNCFLKVLVRYATPGVGIGPSSLTLTPAAIKPASNAASSIYPDTRVSFPIITVSRPSSFKTIPAA